MTKDGRDLGPNKGITHYTIGQRKHLGLSMGHPVFVTDIDAKTGNVTIGDDADVYGTELVCSDLNFMAVPDMEIGETVRLSGKIRYGGKPAPCTVEKTGPDTLRAFFDEPVRAITPGQSAVFYDENNQLCVLVNCSCEKYDWLFSRRYCYVHDGGDCYWRMVINLETGKTLYVSVNGEG